MIYSNPASLKITVFYTTNTTTPLKPQKCILKYLAEKDKAHTKRKRKAKRK